MLAPIVDDRPNQLDTAARFCVVLAVGAAVAVSLLARHGYWLLLPAALLVAVHLRVPADAEGERATNEILSGVP